MISSRKEQKAGDNLSRVPPDGRPSDLRKPHNTWPPRHPTAGGRGGARWGEI